MPTQNHPTGEEHVVLIILRAQLLVQAHELALRAHDLHKQLANEFGPVLLVTESGPGRRQFDKYLRRLRQVWHLFREASKAYLRLAALNTPSAKQR